MSDLIKLTNSDSTGYDGYLYKEGLNTDHHPWNPESCVPGGLHYTSPEYAHHWIYANKDMMVWDVEVPEGTLQIAHPYEYKYKAHSIIMRNPRHMSEIWRDRPNAAEMTVRYLNLSKLCGLDVNEAWTSLTLDQQAGLMREVPALSARFEVPHQLRVEAAPRAFTAVDADGTHYDNGMIMTKLADGRTQLRYTRDYHVPYTFICSRLSHHVGDLPIHAGTRITCAQFRDGLAQGRALIETPAATITCRMRDGLGHGPGVQTDADGTVRKVMWRWGAPVQIIE
jgi:hypothetical protein